MGCGVSKPVKPVLPVLSVVPTSHENVTNNTLEPNVVDGQAVVSPSHENFTNNAIELNVVSKPIKPELSVLSVVPELHDNLTNNAIEPYTCRHLYCEKWGDRFHCCDCQSFVSDEAIVNSEQMKIDGIVDNSTPEDGVNRGVTIGFLLEFAQKHKCFDMTTRDVRRRLIMPATRENRCRYVELPEMRGSTGKAVTFVSHTWGAKFGDLVAAVCDGNADRNRVVWVDIFAVRQWPSRKPDLDFSAVVKQCSACLVVCSSFPEVVNITPLERHSKGIAAIPQHVRLQIAFLRVWCLVEIHEAILRGIIIIIKGGNHVVSKNTVSFESNGKMLGSLSRFVDIEAADATVPEDKERILNGIRSSKGGIVEVNESIRGIFAGAHAANTQPTSCLSPSSLRMPHSLLISRDNVLSLSMADSSGAATSAAEVTACSGCWKNCTLFNQAGTKGIRIAVTAATTTVGSHNGLIRTLVDWQLSPIVCTVVVIQCAACGDSVAIDTLKSSPTVYLASVAGCGYLQLLQQLIDLGGDINASNNVHMTPITAAAYGGHADCIELLLKAGCDVNSRGVSMFTALMLASFGGYVECVEVLLRHECEVNAKNDRGDSAVSCAAQNGHIGCIKLLVEAGADLHACSYDAFPLLLHAAKAGHVECVEYLLQQGCSVNSVQKEGASALTIAAQCGHVACMEVLLKNGADINKQTTIGNTALYHAATQGEVKCIEFLLSNGCDPNIRNNKGSTALLIAEKKGFTECIELLRKVSDRN